MATWTFGVKVTQDTNLAANFYEIQSGYALNFGSGIRDTAMQAISVGSWADNHHVVDGKTVSENDICAGNHAFYCKRVTTTATAYYGYASVDGVNLVGPMRMHSASTGNRHTDDPFMASYNSSSPAPYEGVNFHFDHGVAVSMTPVQLWFGSGDAVVAQHVSCRVEAVELATVSPLLNTGWSHITPDDKLSLSDHNGTSTGHSWWVALTLKPTAISFNSAGRIKIEGTYF